MLTKRKRNGAQVSPKDRGTVQGEPYKSPPRKLIRFFEKSRTQWKAKCRAAKATLKVLKNRIEFLQKSKARWKRRAQALEAEVARLTASGRTISRAGHALKKNGA
jgi:hypothetical protein